MSLAEQFKMEGIEQGAAQKARENAIKMLDLGADPTFIHKVTDLSFAEIEAMRHELVE